VADWQIKPDIFVFLLSLRAGGLGIKSYRSYGSCSLFESDASVYSVSLDNNGTIDEQIALLARVKKDVQDIVIGSKQSSERAKTSDDASLLPDDDELAMVNSLRNPGVSTPTNGDDQGQAGSMIRAMWHEEGDDFFGHETSMEAALDSDVNDEIPPTVPMPTTAIAPKRKGRGREERTRGNQGQRPVILFLEICRFSNVIPIL